MPTIIAILLSLVVLGAEAQPRGDLILFSSNDSNGVSVQYVVSKQRAEKVPLWEPLVAPPPLTLEQAATVGLAWLKAKHPDVTAFVLSGVSFREFPFRPAFAKRWYYQLDFEPIVGGKRLGGSGFATIILFDGSIVEPQPAAPRRP